MSATFSRTRSGTIIATGFCRLGFGQYEALSTNLFRILQCDVSALLLPDSESGELRVTTATR